MNSTREGKKIVPVQSAVFAVRLTLLILDLLAMAVFGNSQALGFAPETRTTKATVQETTIAVPTVIFVEPVHYTFSEGGHPYLDLGSPVNSQGPEAVKVWAVDAAGVKIGDLEAKDGILDYSAYASKIDRIIVEADMVDFQIQGVEQLSIAVP